MKSCPSWGWWGGARGPEQARQAKRQMGTGVCLRPGQPSTGPNSRGSNLWTETMSQALRAQQRNQRKKREKTASTKSTWAVRAVPILAGQSPSLKRDRPEAGFFCSFASLGVGCVCAHISLCTHILSVCICAPCTCGHKLVRAHVVCTCLCL